MTVTGAWRSRARCVVLEEEVARYPKALARRSPTVDVWIAGLVQAETWSRTTGHDRRATAFTNTLADAWMVN